MQLSSSFLLLMMFTSPIFITTVYTSGQKVPSFPTQNAESPSPSSSTSSSLSSSSIWNSGSNRTCLPRKYNNRNITSRLVMNVTRVVDGDLVVVPCRGRCGELCSNIGAIRIRCDLRDWPCICKCTSGSTFMTDSARCVNTFNECSRLRDSESRKSSSDVMFLDLPLSSPTPSSSASSPSSSPSSSPLHSNSPSSSSSSPSPGTTTESSIKGAKRDSLSINGSSIEHEKAAKSHLCTITHAHHPLERTNQKDDIEMNITVLPWQLSITVANHTLSIKWTDTTGAERLKGSIVRINYSCCFHDVLLPPCLVFKIAGSRFYSVATDVLRQSKSTPSTAGNRLGVISGSGDSMTSIFNTSTTPRAPVEFVTSNITNATTADGMTAYEERLEVIVTGLCVGVGILFAFWLVCFLVEKRSQSKYMKRGSDKQNVSQTRQYPHEVATVRKTLMEIYDMPMIRVANSDEEGSESGSGQSTGSRGRNRLESEGDEQNSSTNISSSDQPTGADSSSSEDTLRKKETKKKTTFADPKVHLDIPKEGTPEKFGQWRPVANTGLGSPGEVRSNRFIATSPTAQPKRTLGGGRSPSILKKPSNFNANKSPPSILRFSRGRKIREDPPTIEMNSMGDHLNHGYSSPRKHMKLVSALKTSDSRKHKRTRFKMDEPEATGNCAGAGADTLVPVGNKALPKQLVTCEVHFETPATPILNGELEAEDELDDDDDEEVTERTPLKKNVNFVVVEKGLASKCKFNLSWEDTDGLPCTDV